MPMDGELATRARGAVGRAQRGLWRLQEADGAWRVDTDTGPATTGTVLAMLRWLEDTREEDMPPVWRESDVGPALVYLRSEQLDDGSFRDYPGAERGTLIATACCYAGMVAAGLTHRDDMMKRAWEFIRANGGFKAADFGTQVYLAMVGAMDPNWIAELPGWTLLIPGARARMGRTFVPAITLMITAMTAVIRGLKRRVCGFDAKHPAAKWLHHKESDRLEEELLELMDADGVWFGTITHTLLCVAALQAIALCRDCHRAPSARRSAENREARTKWLAHRDEWRFETRGGGARWTSFVSEVWNTGMALNALVDSGALEALDDASREGFTRGLKYLARWQGKVPQPTCWQNPSPGAPRTGGFPFEQHNGFGSDCDSSSVVLRALGRITAHPEPAFQPYRDRFVEGLAWLRGMQNPDGGWASFSSNHASMPPGALDLDVPPVRPGVWTMLKLIANTPLAYGDPSTADLTGRVLHCLGEAAPGEASTIARGVKFAESQRADNQLWWGRWECNFLAGAAYVLCGLGASGVDVAQRWITEALDRIERSQNADGGWGEHVDSYQNLALAGFGESNVYVTGLVVMALVLCKRGGGEHAARGVEYLISKQLEPEQGEAPDLWASDSYQLPLQPPFPFYKMRINVLTIPLSAVGMWLRAQP